MLRFCTFVVIMILESTYLVVLFIDFIPYNTFLEDQYMDRNRIDGNALHFGIYNHVLTVDNDKLVTRKLIVLKDGKLPVAFTNFDMFAGG